jgi:biotin transport system substrate-specific component
MINARRQTTSRLSEVALIAGASLFIALGAQFRFYLPFSPVPVTAQTLAVLLTGALLGSRRGSAAVLLYLLEGLMGLPVFAGGQGGLASLIGPTGGYLLGFVAAAYVIGLLIERDWDRNLVTIFAALALGNAVIYVFGLLGLMIFVGSESVLTLGLWPFVLGDLFKLACATLALSAGHRAIHSHPE